jgi:hypothetical protein
MDELENPGEDCLHANKTHYFVRGVAIAAIEAMGKISGRNLGIEELKRNAAAKYVKAAQIPDGPKRKKLLEQAATYEEWAKVQYLLTQLSEFTVRRLH